MKHKTTFEKLPQTNVGEVRTGKHCGLFVCFCFKRLFTVYSQITVNVKDISLRASLKKNRASKQLQILLQ